MSNFDQILTSRIGFGLYQYRTLFIVGIALFMNGFSEYYQLQILEVLRTQNYADEAYLEYLSSAQFLGMTAGYLIQTVLINNFGRKNTFIMSFFLQGLGMIAHGAANTLSEMIIIRVLLGVFFATIDTSANPTVCEIVPAQIRGITLSILTFSFILGVFFNGIGCLIFWEDVDRGNWRTLFYIGGIVSIISSLFSIIFLRESPRYLLSNENQERGIIELNLMGFVNKKDQFIPITNEEEKDLKKQFQPKTSEAPNFLNLFDPEYKKTTIILWTLLVLQNIMDKGFIVLIPFIAKDSKQMLIDLPIFNSLEFLSPIVSLLIIDKEEFGRRKGLKLGYSICFLAFIIMYVFKDSSVIFCVTFQRFAQRLTWNFLNIIAMESYNTRIRTLGFGISNCIGKCAGTIAPFIFIPLYYYHVSLPFLVLALITLVNGVVVDLLPSELTLKPLDCAMEVDNKIVEQNSIQTIELQEVLETNDHHPEADQSETDHHSEVIQHDQSNL